ncbi:DNA-binding protein [Faecalicoccus acidiformans]|uniref:DNA-binding protein n=1 Tax=Faecalicoccus acidiformans TaxID=915173 RepID=UPI0025A4232B|nr:DNA-binding protein [Faecalicoccus acidiformans]MDM8202799.1 DNA-binding protein [Faecalicoccus acidiformans]
MTGDMKNKYPIPSDVRMYTREEVAEMIGCHKDHVVMLSEVGCLSYIRIGKRYMYSYEAIKKFQHDYEGFNLSNRVKALEAYRIVESRK